ncbi:WRKY transcription factor 11 [Pyrus ussuriensis x Pyrus communis]|uniref:WRKY transcription factor 11 n=1 Tax=Pyrus ussuriensis x Pyrus communis TaxID=2448454 RepID=A0A5N5F958_9ROSA|nr:WRKY transcription factor 11 [Pyrus ussuriensis x Pyrus communis]
MGLGLDRALVGLQVFGLQSPILSVFSKQKPAPMAIDLVGFSKMDDRTAVQKSCLRRPAKHAAPHPHPVQSNPVPHSTRLPGNHRLHRHQVQAPNLRLEPDRPRTPRSSSSGRRFPSPLTSRTWVLLALLRKKWK